MIDDNTPRIDPEYREAIILSCPNCPHEYEVNFASIKCEALNICPKCKFEWISDSDYTNEFFNT